MFGQITCFNKDFYYVPTKKRIVLEIVQPTLKVLYDSTSYYFTSIRKHVEIFGDESLEDSFLQHKSYGDRAFSVCAHWDYHILRVVQRRAI